MYICFINKNSNPHCVMEKNSKYFQFILFIPQYIPQEIYNYFHFIDEEIEDQGC